MPDPFIGIDTTKKDVTDGIADPSFNTIFNAKANLGTIKLQSVSILSSGGTFGTPTIVANYTGATETTVLF